MNETTCQHHWVLETAAGPTSKGVCQRCGMQKEFQNTVETHLWVSEARRGRPAPGTEG